MREFDIYGKYTYQTTGAIRWLYVGSVEAESEVDAIQKYIRQCPSALSINLRVKAK